MDMSEIVLKVSKIDNNSARLLSKIKKYIPSGSSSTMRVIGYHKPLVVDRAEGAKIWDADENELIDYNMGYGPLIFGHRSKIVNDAIKEQLETRGAILGFSTSLYIDVGMKICDSFPSIEMMRFAMTGSEVNQTAIRLARVYTGRTHVILFEGHYHGSSDSVFHKYNCSISEINEEGEYSVRSGTNGMNGAPHNAYLLPWNDYETLSTFLAANGDRVAAMIMEPVMGNSGVIPPQGDFLRQTRELCDKYGIVLIFDEVITGCRVARGGAQERYNVKSDITTLSKAAIGGFPGSIIGGKKEIMQLITENKVFHGGVYSGNPLTLGVALATQCEFEKNGRTIFDELNRKSDILSDGMREVFKEADIPVCINNVGAMLSIFFITENKIKGVNSFRDYVRADKIKHILFQHILQDMGVYFHPNNLEPWYLSTAHTDEIIHKTLDIVRVAAKKLRTKC